MLLEKRFHLVQRYVKGQRIGSDAPSSYFCLYFGRAFQLGHSSNFSACLVPPAAVQSPKGIPTSLSQIKITWSLAIACRYKETGKHEAQVSAESESTHRLRKVEEQRTGVIRRQPRP